MTKPGLFPVSDIALKNTRTDKAEAERQRALAVSEPERFWSGVAERITWSTPFTEIKDVSYDENDLHIRWFRDGKLNACVNCLDRHLPERADDPAIIWEGDDPADHKVITYAEALEETSRMANLLKARDIGRGDRVVIRCTVWPFCV